MLQPFLIAFRESLQCSLIIALVLMYPDVRAERVYARNFISGVLFSFILGFSAGYIPSMGLNPGNTAGWTFWRYISETVIFYSGIALISAKMTPNRKALSTGLAALGFLIFFFEARTFGFFIHDTGLMQERLTGITVVSITGILAGFVPLVLLKQMLKKIPFEKALIIPSLLMTIGALKFAFGGVGELEKGNILIAIQKGLSFVLDNVVRNLQAGLMLSGHPFIDVPFSNLADFICGDRTAMSLTMLFIMAPPLFILIHLFARPDPIVGDIEAGAQRRLSIAFFRKELVYQSIPILTAFIILVVLIHEVNISMNPLYEPVPIPVKEAENEDILKIPTSDLTDKKLKKYVYYQILFLVVLKPDGSVGVALDQCEICRPAKWNKDAQGYAQKGDHLICKYCMTPIALPTVNNPGGCNPIPVPFKLGDSHIIIKVGDLIGIFKDAEALDKKGTHL